MLRNAQDPLVSLNATTSADGSVIDLDWEATDSDSGLAMCTLQYRIDDGDWQLHSQQCAGTETFDAQPGHTYTFRLSATDHVGNEAQTEAGAFTTAVTKYHYFGARRVAMRDPDDAVVWLHGDHLGSTSLATDAAGALLPGSDTHYYPFGQVRTGGDLPTDFGYTGQRLDATGLMFYHARYYAPYLNRFISADTVVPEPGNPQSLNRYSYVGNNPLVYVDPSGNTRTPPPQPTPAPPPPTPTPVGTPVPVQPWDPLTPAQWELCKQAAARFQIPVELVAATVATEIVFDTDWDDPVLDAFLEAALSARFTGDATGGLFWDRFLAGYEHYWGLAEGRGPGPGVANVHIGTAKDAEEYFATYYPDEHLLDPPLDKYVRMSMLLHDDHNIYYTAAILKQFADLRKGSGESPALGPHLDDLTVTDMQIIYGAFRAGTESYGWEITAYQTVEIPGTYGLQSYWWLHFYEDK